MGTQLHRGLARHFGGLGPGRPYVFEWIERDDDDLAYAAAFHLYTRCMEKALALEPEILGPGASVVAVEWALGDGASEGTTDLVIKVNDPEGTYLKVVDWKFHGHLKTEYIPSRLEETQRTWQFRHYGWQAEKAFGLPVKYLCKGMIVGGPKVQAHLYTVKVEPHALTYWAERDAGPVWDLMERGVVWRNPKGCRPYGERYPCAYERACWEGEGDIQKMSAWYEKGER